MTSLSGRYRPSLLCELCFSFRVTYTLMRRVSICLGTPAGCYTQRATLILRNRNGVRLLHRQTGCWLCVCVCVCVSAFICRLTTRSRGFFSRRLSLSWSINSPKTCYRFTLRHVASVWFTAVYFLKMKFNTIFRCTHMRKLC